MADVTLESTGDVAMVSFRKPVLSMQALTELEQALDIAADRGGHHPVVLRSLHPTIFLAGAHLAEIATLDRATSGTYAERGRAVLDRLGRMPVPTVVAVHGSCSGGGFDLALACDRIVATGRARFSHPGVLRGLVTGWGGTVRLPAATGYRQAELAVIAAGPLAARDLAPRALVADRGGDVVDAAIAEAHRLAGVHPDRLRVWRALRDRPDLQRRRVTGYNRVSRGADTDGRRNASRATPGDGETA